MNYSIIKFVLGWIVMSLIGALPFYISGEIPFYLDAFFKSYPGLQQREQVFYLT